jgi:CheY-like chemotaxis protein
MIPIKRILVLDDKESVRQSFQESLESRGYKVYAAATPEEADEILARVRIQMAIVDVRLRDDRDEGDRTGIEYARNLDPAIVVLHLSAWREKNLLEVAYDAPEGTRPIAYFLSKSDEIEYTLDKIDEAFTREVSSQINRTEDLLEWKRRFGLKQLVQPLLLGFDCDEDRLIEEVEELLRRLSLAEDKVKLYPMEFGRGGGAIVFARPTIHPDTNGEPFVIKLGWVKDIQLEIDNYRKYVLPYSSRYSTTFRSGEVRTPWLMGFKMTFVGGTLDKPRDFNSVFVDDRVSDSQLKELTRRVFKVASAKWYENKKPSDWDGLGPGADPYRQLAVDLAISFDAGSELSESVQSLLDGQSYHHVDFAASGAERICVTIDGTKEELFNPLKMLRAQHGRLPRPSFWAITHGDLNGKNILVDSNFLPWLIDFTRTSWGAALRDVAELESAIVFDLIHKLSSSVSLIDLLAFQKAILIPTQFDQEIEMQASLRTMPFTRVLAAVQTLRDMAADIIETKRIGEYYVLLLHYALKMITWKGITSLDQDVSDVRRRHAMYAALLLCDKLDNRPTPERESILI